MQRSSTTAVKKCKRKCKKEGKERKEVSFEKKLKFCSGIAGSYAGESEGDKEKNE